MLRDNKRIAHSRSGGILLIKRVDDFNNENNRRQFLLLKAELCVKVGEKSSR